MNINIFPVKDPQSQKSTFLNALVATVYLASLLIVMVALLSSVIGGPGLCVFENGGNSCDILPSLIMGFVIYFGFATIFTAGLNIIIPTLVIWAIMEFKRKREQQQSVSN